MERRLSAILAADVVGYSRLIERDEDGTFDRLQVTRKELFEPEIERHHGRIFKLTGDGFLAEFGSVVDAVECAVSVQRGMHERNRDLAGGERIDMRMGINLGLIDDLDISHINELFIHTQPAHLQKIQKVSSDVDERNMARAAYLRNRLSSDHPEDAE